MIWVIIFYSAGGILGWVLCEADIHADDWQFWAILLCNSLSQFSLAQMATERIRKKYQKILDDYHQEVMKLFNFNISEVENDE